MRKDDREDGVYWELWLSPVDSEWLCGVADESGCSVQSIIRSLVDGLHRGSLEGDGEGDEVELPGSSRLVMPSRPVEIGEDWE